ncbi:MAG: response regulator [Candidatus Omnitrophica bacterium]|nr:response regulator [Candidatus Omnitrophota bacterium]
MPLSDALNKKEAVFIKLALKGTIAGFDRDLGLLFSNKIKITQPSFDYVSQETLITSLPQAFVKAVFMLEGDCPGEAIIIFNVPDAKIMCGLLMMVPAEGIKQGLHKEFSAEDEEVFKEIANQMNGTLDASLRESFTFNFHSTLKSVEAISKSLTEETARTLFPDDYVAVRAALKIAEFPDSFFTQYVSMSMIKSISRSQEIDKEQPQIMEAIKIAAAAETTKDVKSVLLAGIDAGTREGIKNSLNGHDLNFLEINDGMEVLSMLLQRKISLVIIDQELPSIDGLEVCKKIKQNYRTKDVPVIICSAYSTRENVLAAASAGAQDFIVKPINKKEEIEQKILACLQ